MSSADPGHVLRGRRTLVLTITAGGVVGLLGWTAYLTATLPDGTSVGAWRTAWVGFDTMLVMVLGTSAWLVWNRRQLAVTGLTIAASLLVVDARSTCVCRGTRRMNGARC